MSLNPAQAPPRGNDVGHCQTAEYRRSPFLSMEFDSSELVVVNCLTTDRYYASPLLVAALSSLHDWTPYCIFSKEHPTISIDILADLCVIGLVQIRNHLSESHDETSLSSWHPADLDLLKQRNRLGPINDEFVRSPKSHGSTVEVPLPPPRPLPREPFSAVLVRRRSIRTYQRLAVGLPTVSDLLHHASRRTPWFQHLVLGAHALHSYPNAGALSELELYLIAHDVDELQPAVYRYDSVSHILQHRRDIGPLARSQLDQWMLSSLNLPPESVAPPLLILVSAVIGRMTAKYGRNGLLLANQDLGCLYQTLYLVATTLKLAPCAIGTGPGPQISEWLGTSYSIEPIIGGFVIGHPIET